MIFNKENIIFEYTTMDEFSEICSMFDSAIIDYKKLGYYIWDELDKKSIKNDIIQNNQIKLVYDHQICAFFTFKDTDNFVWKNVAEDKAFYINRILIRPPFRGQKLFTVILNWLIKLAVSEEVEFIRLDTWANNAKTIKYYESFGFTHIKNFTFPNMPEIAIQDRNLEVALLQYNI